MNYEKLKKEISANCLAFLFLLMFITCGSVHPPLSSKYHTASNRLTIRDKTCAYGKPTRIHVII